MRRFIRWGSAAVLLWVIACRLAPGLSARWQVGVALPVLSALHRLTAPVGFPLLELLGLALIPLALGRRGPRRLALALLLLAAGYALLWYPAYWARPVENWPAADAQSVRALCDQLIDRLNASEPASDDPLTDTGAKAARYPEWMSALGIAGLFSPWTGEIIVDATASPDLLPFTCLHERAHLLGIADEGAANIAAYRDGLSRGGAYARSARLWALRYALNRLSQLDEPLCREALARMDPELVASFTPFAAAPHPLARALGIGPATSDYDALVDWLAGGGVGEGTGKQE